MAAHGKNTCVKIDNSAGTLVDLSAYIDSEDLSRQADAVDVTAFAAAATTQPAKAVLPGLKDATFSISIVWDAVIDRHIDMIVGRTGSFEIGPDSSTSGRVKYSGEALCTGYSVDAPVGDKITGSAEFQVTGDVTRGTW